jgi:hypothetical protein
MSQPEERVMIPRIAIAAAAVAAICSTAPASAQDVGIGVGPGGVTVGTSRDRGVVREREVIRNHDDRRGRDETVVIRKLDRDHYDDGPNRRVIIERD